MKCCKLTEESKHSQSLQKMFGKLCIFIISEAVFSEFYFTCPHFSCYLKLYRASYPLLLNHHLSHGFPQLCDIFLCVCRVIHNASCCHLLTQKTILRINCKLYDWWWTFSCHALIQQVGFFFGMKWSPIDYFCTDLIIRADLTFPLKRPQIDHYL